MDIFIGKGLVDVTIYQIAHFARKAVENRDIENALYFIDKLIECFPEHEKRYMDKIESLESKIKGGE